MCDDGQRYESGNARGGETEIFTDAPGDGCIGKTTGATEMDQPATTTKCTRCGKPADPVVYKTIIDQAYDPVRQKKYVRQQSLPFCSEEHANHHQWSCEG
ncbi:hypothetical protein [Pseudomonas sp. BF-B-26]|jgi:endogenous inhibitor of DNA gyrase (YacG/DUF329 family)|uniref:hypothetical protein n=1 Tax=Pseudomonas sp. BF-B-26 TaxID=2832400 RepID=UPI001CBEB2AD|nr:hypothetical protein [Pseudomonas sp. BF-B-26]